MATPTIKVYEMILYDSGVKGETRVWTIEVITPELTRSASATIIRRHGVLGGAMTETKRVIMDGKNIGRSNETTPTQQAIAEAKSIVVKKIREGYKEKEEDRGKTEVILPMLAQDWNKTKKLPTLPLYAQPKIDGVRMIVNCVGGNEVDGFNITMTTRQGKDIYFMEHIREALSKGVLRPGFVLDGELYCREKSFEEITGIVRKSVAENTRVNEIRMIEYHIFDMFFIGEEKTPFKSRLEYLNSLPAFLGEDSPVKVVETKLLKTEEEVESFHRRMNEEGNEGTIYRTPNGEYKVRARSKDLLKRKDFITEEYKIVGVEEADGRDIGTVIWVVEVKPGGARFNVRPRGSLEQRAEWFKNGDKYMGKMLTVRFQNLSDFGIPRFPVGLSIRDYE